MHNEDIAMLVDTGANVTLLSQNFVNQLKTSCKPDIRPVNTSLVTATGESTPFHEQTNVTLSIGSKCYDHNVLIANISNDGILGLGFLVKHACNVNLAEETLNIGYEGERVPCHRFVSNALSTCFKIAVTKNIETPSRSETIVPGTTVDGYLPGQFAFIEGAQKFVERKGLLVAKSLVKVNKDIIPLRVVNLLDEPCMLYKGTIAATGDEVKSEDVCVFEKVQKVSTGETTCADLEPQKIPEHLKDLIDRSSAHLPPDEQNKLKDLLCSYQHLFSKDSSDLGHTTLVRHEMTKI